MKATILGEISLFFSLKPNSRSWHIPLLAAICAGVPSLVGWYSDEIQIGTLGTLGGLVILYFNVNQGFALRMLTLLLTSMGFIISYAVGSLSAFNPYVAAVTLGIYAMGINWVTGYLQLRPPGNFFFIMVAAMSAYQAQEFKSIAFNVGIVALSVGFACLMGLIYSILFRKNESSVTKFEVKWTPQFTTFVESIILGGFIMLCKLVGTWFNLPNAYWIPISALAIMQGVSHYHVWQRTAQRIIGTMAGLILAYFIIEFTSINPLYAVLSIIALQWFIELLVVRNYALAVIFITPMTILLADNAALHAVPTSELISSRLMDIIIGSLIGAVGGYFLHHEKIRHKAVKSLRVIRISLKR